PEVAERLKQAIELGDISENSEYEDAKNQQGFIEGRILQLEKMLRNAKVIDGQEINENVVSAGSKVKLIEVNGGQEVEYMIVGSAEADPTNFKISNESPVGRSLMGQKVGKVVNVNVPMGVIQYKIVGLKK
ncbi:MAG TPA: transcription elongation factor GreA, partial [Firmicutes bacterium]|nr:transcription elongation factor GreA [Bacillota bacterium]